MKLVRSRDMFFHKDQTLGDFDKPNQSKGTSDDFIELVPIPLSLEQPTNEDEEINELPRDVGASDIPAQELVEHEKQVEQEDLIPQARRSTREMMRKSHRVFKKLCKMRGIPCRKMETMSWYNFLKEENHWKTNACSSV